MEPNIDAGLCSTWNQKLSHLAVDTEIHHAPHSQYRRFRPLDDSKEMRFARLTAMLRTSIAFASRSHSAHTSRNPNDVHAIQWDLCEVLCPCFLSCRWRVERTWHRTLPLPQRGQEGVRSGYLVLPLAPAKCKLRRGWPLRGQQVSRIKWRLLRTSLGINSTPASWGPFPCVSLTVWHFLCIHHDYQVVALLLHSMSDETNTSGRKSCQSPHADESTTLLKTKNTPEICPRRPPDLLDLGMSEASNGVPSSFVPVYRGKKSATHASDSFLDSTVLCQLAKNCVSMTCTTQKVESEDDSVFVTTHHVRVDWLQDPERTTSTRAMKEPYMILIEDMKRGKYLSKDKRRHCVYTGSRLYEIFKNKLSHARAWIYIRKGVTQRSASEHWLRLVREYREVNIKNCGLQAKRFSTRWSTMSGVDTHSAEKMKTENRWTGNEDR